MSDLLRELSKVTNIAKELADVLFPFRDAVPESSIIVTDIAATVFLIEKSLKKFSDLCYDPQYGAVDKRLHEEIRTIVTHSFRSVKELDRIYHQCISRRGTPVSLRSHKKILGDILTVFEDWSGSNILIWLRRDLNNLENLVSYIGLKLNKPPKNATCDPENLLRKIRSQAYDLEREAQGSPPRGCGPTRPPLVRTGSVLPPPVNPYPSPPASFQYGSAPMRPYSTPGRSAYHPPPPLPPPPYKNHYGHPPPQMPINQHQIPRYDPNQLTPPISPVTPTNITPVMLGNPGSPHRVPAPRRYSQTPAPDRSQWGMSTPPGTPPMEPRTTRHIGVGRTSSAVKGRREWFAQVFDNNRPNVRGSFGETMQVPTCFGAHMDDLGLAPDDIEVFRVGADNDLTLRMFRNDRTSAVRVVCTTGGAGGSWTGASEPGVKHQSAIDATSLSVERVGGAIRLSTPRYLWAVINFADYASLTLFFHAFLGLRHRAPNAPLPVSSESCHNEEEEFLFAAKITGDFDNGREQNLRMLKDKTSGELRIDAAFVSQYDEVTVWTAFITEQITEHGWIKKLSRRRIVLHNVRQFSFDDDFETKMVPKLMIKFKNEEDVVPFMKMIEKQRDLRMDLMRKKEGQRRSPTAPPPGQRSSRYFP
ncbi:hypothetical protein EX30DRAFT_261177 [Ascodesmis nigricans]|uniref:Uncharacterized protein n=1 Tax=Ascodesmis nigricans TaxID=341454 RepID=A0A4S2MXQ1_9PEZI|nr:hypothetical protein EX30DRAFT_261177 [Ascodesmis nigricans]